ncbi:MAG: PfkB family carbohydrate kinase [Candidatus Limnocylindrales bacterium]
MIEAVVLGRVGVDLTPVEPRTSLAAASSFVRAVGGFAGNVGTGLARLGISTAILSSVGEDGHGDHVRSFLAAEGIDVSGLVRRPDTRTQVAFFEAWPPDRFPVTFYRLQPPPETMLTLDEIGRVPFFDTPMAVVSATMLAAEPARTAVLTALGRRATTRGVGGGLGTSTTILDLDWRPSLWEDPGEAPGLIAQALPSVDVVVGGDDEFAAARLDPAAALDGGPGIVALKHGPDGVSIVTRSGRRRLEGRPVEVVCGLGSGDAFLAAFAAGLYRGDDPAVAAARGDAAGAIVASRLMCSIAMPRPSEIDGMLEGRPPAPREVTV